MWTFPGSIFFVTITPMYEVPTQEPTEVTANDAITWRRTLVDFPPSEGWELSYALRGPALLDITATADAGGYLVSNSAPATSGEYYLQGYVTRNTERHTVYSGNLTVKPDLSAITTGTYDGRSRVKRTLDAIDAVLENRASQDELQLEINTGTSSRRLARIPHDQLLKLRSVYAGLYWRELNPGKIGPSVTVTFGRGY